MSSLLNALFGYESFHLQVIACWSPLYHGIVTNVVCRKLVSNRYPVMSSVMRPGKYFYAIITSMIPIFLPPGCIRSINSYNSSGFLLVSLTFFLVKDITSDTRISQSRNRFIFGFPLIPIKQCSLLWLSQWPVFIKKGITCSPCSYYSLKLISFNPNQFLCFFVSPSLKTFSSKLHRSPSDP